MILQVEFGFITQILQSYKFAQARQIFSMVKSFLKIQIYLLELSNLDRIFCFSANKFFSMF